MCSMLTRQCALCWRSLVIVMTLAGCGQPVREDRSINFSKGGQSVSFQHGSEGVFLADKDGSNLTKIFQPDQDVIATSTPLWSPVDRKAIFTTARRTQEKAGISWSVVDGDNPAGTAYLQQAVRYTCWFLDREASADARPIPIFEASCDHVGYVAANLAVRWHPDGQSIFFVKQGGNGKHELVRFDLKTKETAPAFPHSSEAILFDWTAEGSYLVCVLGSSGRHEDPDGIWIGRPDQNDWWHVPQSSYLAPGELSSLLESLRASRPAWTKDASRFAFVSYLPGVTKNEPGLFTLHLGTPANRHVEELVRGKDPFRDLSWAPEGQRLGVVLGNKEPSLHILRPREKLSPSVSRRPVRRFAGWNFQNDHLA